MSHCSPANKVALLAHAERAISLPFPLKSRERSLGAISSKVHVLVNASTRRDIFSFRSRHLADGEATARSILADWRQTSVTSFINTLTRPFIIVARRADDPAIFASLFCISLDSICSDFSPNYLAVYYIIPQRRKQRDVTRRIRAARYKRVLAPSSGNQLSLFRRFARVKKRGKSIVLFY